MEFDDATPSASRGMSLLNLREAYVEAVKRLTVTIQGDASAFSGIIMV